MNPEVDALQHFFAAVNRNDMEAITRDFDPQLDRWSVCRWLCVPQRQDHRIPFFQ
jgi:hypothetical protein